MSESFSPEDGWDGQSLLCVDTVQQAGAWVQISRRAGARFLVLRIGNPPPVVLRPVDPCLLSVRHLQVLQLLADGAGSTNAVAEALGLSPLTVKAHLCRIGRRLGTGCRAGMVATALRRGWIT